MKSLFKFTIVFLLIVTSFDIALAGFYDDNDFDGSDLAAFAVEFNNCSSGCSGDFIGDGDVDRPDMKTFASNFGRIDRSLPISIGEIGTEGGILEVLEPLSNAFGTIIEIKENSIEETTNIIISEADVSPEVTSQCSKAGVVLDLGPNGINFDDPAFITMPYYDQDGDGIVDGTEIPEEEVYVLYFNEIENNWNQVVVVDRDPINNTITFEANHFSLYVPYVRIFIDELIDWNAIPSAKQLYVKLGTVNDSNRFIFGQHMALTITKNGDKTYDSNTPSDCMMVTGVDPGFNESDFMWYSYPVDPEAVKSGDEEIEYKYDSKLIGMEEVTFRDHDILTLTNAYINKDIIIGYCWHLRGRYSGEFSMPDNPSLQKTYSFVKDMNLVSEILDPTDQSGSREWFYDKLDDEVIYVFRKFQNNNIPIIFRPWHEMNGGWFWWGKNSCSSEEFKQLWRLTIDYIKGSGIHNVIYAWSPDKWFQRDGNLYDDGMNYYPGHAYVDILGLDSYEPGLVEYYTNIDFVEQIEKIGNFSIFNSKITAITETGDRIKEDTSDFWTSKILYPIVNGSVLDRLAYVSTWYNGFGDYFIPFSNIDDDLAYNDFVFFKKNQSTLFAGEYNREPPPVNYNLVSYWSFDFARSEDMGIDDLNIHNGQVNGNAIPAKSLVANGCYFDGSDDYIQIAPNLSELTGSNFTIMTWINIAGLPDFNVDRASFFTNDVHCAAHRFQVSDPYNGHARITFSAATGCNQGVGLGAEVNVGQWYFVATTYDGSNLSLMIWDVDRNIVFSDSVSVNSAITPWNGSVKIGGNERLGRYFNGFLDEMRVFNIALTVEEIHSYINR
jgi:mannan endo-1,4-beta-mannosidase